MKTVKLCLAIVTISLFSACGGSNKPKESHAHDENCTHSHAATSADSAHHQESFTIDADSTHVHHADSCGTKGTKPHTHSDGKTHKH
jgi:hypothetical protein